MCDAVVEPAEIKRRSTEVAKLVKQISLERNQRWIGWSGEVLVDEKGKVANSWICRNFAYKPVTLKSSENLLGKTLRLKIVKAFFTHLAGTTE
jgi:tRNA A37 methylthiotransferase MiaB